MSVPYQRPEDPGLQGKILNNRYKVLETLGKGSFGATYIALDTHLFNKRRALKQLKPAKLDSFNVSTARRLFEREAQTLDKLGSHDQIPTLYAYFEENNDFYLVLELIEGKTLDKEEIKLGHKVSEAKVIDLLEGVLEPLAFLHANQVIHRDIKPSNLIRRQSDGKIVLIDFGAVKDISQNPVIKGSSTVAIGSTGYRPLEQAQGRPQLASDIYAVGMLAIQALTAEEPWMLPEKEGQVIWQAEVSTELASYLAKMIRRNYQDRFQNAAEALEALQTLKALKQPRHRFGDNDESKSESMDLPIPPDLPPDKYMGHTLVDLPNPIPPDLSTSVEDRASDGYIGHTIVDPVTPPLLAPNIQNLVPDGYSGHTIVDPHYQNPPGTNQDTGRTVIHSQPNLEPQSSADTSFLVSEIPADPSHYYELDISEFPDKPVIEPVERPSIQAPISPVRRRRFIYSMGSALVVGAAIIKYWTMSSKGSASRFKFESVKVDAQGNIIQRIPLETDYFLEELETGISLPMVKIPAGSFIIGSPPQEIGRDRDEEPQQAISLNSAFWMGQFPVTQDQWRTVALWEKDKITLDLNPEPANFKGSNRPVEQISWYEAVEFCQRLSQRSGKTYRLPSEAEWEYTCRAQTSTPFHFGETITTDIANFDGNSIYQAGPPGLYRGETTPVGSFAVANAFGLYDMHGNVREWCLDPQSSSYEGISIHGDPMISTPSSGYRATRGGSWLDQAVVCRSANRLFLNANEKGVHVGFRVVCIA